MELQTYLTKHDKHETLTQNCTARLDVAPLTEFIKEQEPKAPFRRGMFHVGLYRNRTDRHRVYTGTDGIVPYRTASGARTGPPRK